jgi:hypothetical protein
MTNSQTPHSRALRQKTAIARRERIIAEGGMNVQVLLEKPAADVLRALTSDGTSRTQVVREALLKHYDRSNQHD